MLSLRIDSFMSNLEKDSVDEESKTRPENRVSDIDAAQDKFCSEDSLASDPRRQLDPQRALSKISDASKREEASSGLAGIRNALEAGTAAVARMQERNAYHWVDIRSLCLV